MNIVFQLILNSIISGLLLSLIALGFFFIFNVSKVFHLAHGAVYVLGSYLIIFFCQILNYPFLFGLLLTLIIITLLALCMEVFVYRQLNNKISSQAISLISSMGIYLFIINLIALCFGNESKILDHSFGLSIEFWNIIITPIQIIQLIFCFSFLILIFLFSKSQLFLKIKAVISHSQISSILGININFIRLFSISLGSTLAVIASILKLFDTGINPYSGFGIVLSSAVAVIIGGNNSLLGTILASFFLAFLQTITEWFLSSQWKDGITFIILIAVILFKTEGIVSFKMRIEEN